LFTAIIGVGATTGLGSSATFDVVDWGSSNHLLKVEINYNGSGYVDMGTTAFMSVPYALYSANSASDGAQGPQFPVQEGPQGPAGANGVDGTNGVDGINGTDGVDGSQGPQGIPGPAGTTVTYSVGDLAQGGIVFYVSTDGKNGLVAATQDQSTASDWYNAQDYISNPSNHTIEGRKFRDWRLPTKHELNEMYVNLHQLGLGGFGNNEYWSSTSIFNDAFLQDFSSGTQDNAWKYDPFFYVRAVRAF